MSLLNFIMKSEGMIMKIGLEIHQRLDTHKLFCSCPSKLIENAAPDAVIQRRLHPVLSELGEVDEVSRIEFQKDRIFEYQVFSDADCLVETDEEPPHSLNPEALDIALEIALHLNAKPIREVHIMRKIVIDGSNTAGFQRTAFIAMNGYIETSKGRIGIPQVMLEEESAGIVLTEDNKVVYRLDRLGIPLVEITTTPDIVDGAHLLEVAEKLGMILRATGKVARGLGTIRQDVNISIEGGARIEIKGAQDLKLLPLLAEQEVRRQKELITIMDELKTRFGGKVLASRSFLDITGIFSNTGSKLIRTGVDAGHRVLALKLHHHKGFLGKEIQANRRYGSELSDYAKSAGVKGIIHSDELMERYNISAQEVAAVKKTLNMHEDDAFVLVVASDAIARKALENVCIRAEMDFVPKETRKANPDGSTSFMRPLPGRARLYPETDIPPIRVTKEMLHKIEKEKGEGLEAKKEKLAVMLNPEMAEKILRSRNLHLFERIIDKLRVDATTVATTLENTLVSLRREGIEIEGTKLEAVLFELFEKYKKEKFVKAAIPEILKLVAKGRSIDAAIKEGKLERIGGAALEKIAKENNFDIQKIMQKYRLNIEPSELQKIKK